MNYDLTRGEGRRIWEECLLRAQLRPSADGDHDHPQPRAASEAGQFPLGDRYGSEQLVRPRLGQGTFRVAVTDAYGRACAVTSEHTLPALEAAHIQRYSRGGLHHVSNGILLRADVHRLFDLGYVTITPKYTFRVSPRIEEVYKNGRSYYPLDRKPIHLPDDEADRPDRRLLEEHEATMFLG
jgi:putative restriction endonuclease